MRPQNPKDNEFSKLLQPEREKAKRIAHRGNVTGPSEYENNPEYIQEALNDGFDVEVDIWYNGTIRSNLWEGWWLGHDKPQYKVDEKFLRKERLWLHAKNYESLFQLSKLENAPHYFWHENDKFTLTSQGFIWTYPGNFICEKSVIVCTSKEDFERSLHLECAGICSDWLK